MKRCFIIFVFFVLTLLLAVFIEDKAKKTSDKSIVYSKDLSSED